VYWYSNNESSWHVVAKLYSTGCSKGASKIKCGKVWNNMIVRSLSFWVNYPFKAINWQLQFILEGTSYPLWDRVFYNNHNLFFSVSCATWITLANGGKSISVHWHYSVNTMTCNLRTASHRNGSPKPHKPWNKLKQWKEWESAERQNLWDMFLFGEEVDLII